MQMASEGKIQLRCPPCNLVDNHTIYAIDYRGHLTSALVSQRLPISFLSWKNAAQRPLSALVP